MYDTSLTMLKDARFTMLMRPVAMRACRTDASRAMMSRHAADSA